MTWQRALAAILITLALVYAALWLSTPTLGTAVDIQMRAAIPVPATSPSPPTHHEVEPPQSPGVKPWVGELEEILVEVHAACPTGGPSRVLCEGTVCVVAAPPSSLLDRARHAVASPVQTVSTLAIQALGQSYGATPCGAAGTRFYERATMLRFELPGSRCVMVVPGEPTAGNHERALRLCDELL